MRFPSARVVRGGCLLALSAITVTACGNGTGSTPTNGGTLTYVIDADAQSLNPFEAADVPSVRALMPLFPNLYQADKNLNVVPDLADGMPTISSDLLTWTVKIKQGAKWSDGTDITSDDVVKTVQMQANPNLDTDASFDWSALTDPVKGVAAVDKYTVKFTLSSPFAPFLASNLLTFVAPAEVYSKIDPAKMRTDSSNNTPTVTGGPYKFVSRTPGQEIDLAANTSYYNGAPHIAKIIEKVITNSTAAAQALINGDVQWDPEVTAADVAQVKAASGISAYEYPDLAYYDVRFNDRPGHLFSDVNVRKAFAYALDKASIVQTATDGFGTPIWGDIPPASAYYDDSAVVKYKQNIAMAQQLMAQAGWTKGSDGILQKGGKKFTAQFYVRSDKDQRVKAVTIMSEQLRQNLGMDLKPAPTDFKVFYKPIFAGQYDLAFAGWGLNLDPDDYTIFHSSQIRPEANKSGSNFTGYKNPELDAAIEAERKDLKSTQAATFAARKADFAKIEKILGENVVVYFMWADNVAMGFSDNVQGVVPGQGGSLNYVDQDRNNSAYAQWYLKNVK
jgi:peptide/nickel transport system substrate-binding protein